jgi:hypothetical protein
LLPGWGAAVLRPYKGRRDQINLRRDLLNARVTVCVETLEAALNVNPLAAYQRLGQKRALYRALN